MAATAQEALNSRLWTNTEGKYTGKFVYNVSGAASEAEAFLAIASASSAQEADPEGNYIMRQAISITEFYMHNGIGKGEVTYQNFGTGSSGGGAGGSTTMSKFSISGEMVRIKQSLHTVYEERAKHTVTLSDGTNVTAPALADLGGAINMQPDGSVEGVDVSLPVGNLNYVMRYLSTTITNDTRRKWYSYFGSVNEDSILGMNPGEMKLIGVEENPAATGITEVTFTFEIRFNDEVQEVRTADNQLIFDSLGGDGTKNGHDYIWVQNQYVRQGTSPSVMPIARRVEKIFPRKDFSQLFTTGGV